ncbi:MAG TPA: glycosyltransferase family 1 protein [Anaerolineales bacterium]
MKIALDAQSTIGNKTGIGRYAAELLAALRRVSPEHEYLPLTWGREVVMRTDRRLRWQQVELPRRARAAGAALLHVPGFDAPFWRPCPVVLTVHDLIGRIFPENLPPVARFYWAWWLPRSVHWAQRIIASSENTRRDLERLLGISSQKVSVVPLGVDPAFHPIDDPEVLQPVRVRYNLPADFFLYVGTLEPRKGLDTLLDAYTKVVSRFPEQHLVIAGQRGWYTDYLFRQVQQLGISQRVHFTEYVAAGDLPALYNLGRAFIFPSRYEGFGLPPLEAMACGTPVISSNASSLPEVVGEAGLLVPPDQPEALAQALAGLLEDPELQVKLRARGLERASQFTWEATARGVLAVYRSVGERL